MSARKRSLQTDMVHAGESAVRMGGAVVPPIFQSATFEYGGASVYQDLKYIRLNNTPNHEAVQAKIAAAAGGESCVVTGSGMAAISTALLTLLKTGEHVLIQDCLYGGTHSLVTQDLPDMGVSHTFIDGGDPGSWPAALTDTTRVIYVETMTNPLLRIADHRAVVQFARERGLVSVIDNTFASPVNFRPLELGYDLELHSATKYLNGHSDIVAGCVIGTTERVRAVLHRLNHLGGCLDPHACFLLHRGLRTLTLRVEQHNRNGERLAEALASHPSVASVSYPSLPSHPDHDRARDLMPGFGGVLSFELKAGVEAADRLIAGLELPICAPSLGGVETLITRPVTTSHSGLSPKEREASGISEGLVRVACGIETCDDLVADFVRALDAVG